MTAFALVCLFALTAPAVRAAEEEPTHLFNATLSLTGDCSVSGTDPVPDPGLCPMPPGVAGVDHPTKPFLLPRGTAIDAYGNRYIASHGKELIGGVEGRIDVFDPAGHFITEIADPNGPHSVAVDSEGNLYVSERGDAIQISRFSPTGIYKPGSGEIEYGAAPVIVDGDPGLSNYAGIAINPINDHLFYDSGNSESAIVEYGSAAEGNKLLDSGIGKGFLQESKLIAIDAAHKKIYVPSAPAPPLPPGPVVVQVFDLDPPHALVGTIDGSTTPAGKFTSDTYYTAVAAEEATGHVFVGDLAGARKVYEFEEDGSYVSSIAHNLQPANTADIAIDNGPKSPKRGYLFVPSGEATPGHSFAFEPKPVVKSPLVESVSVTGVTEEEAVLGATINPKGAAVSYRFEYTTQQSFEEEGFANAAVGGEGTIAASNEGSSVSANAAGLAPHTAYRFRVVAENEAGPGEKQAGFITYRPLDPSTACENQALRTEASAALPDCRAYELVTPADTSGHAPLGRGDLGDYFTTRNASPAGNAVSFALQGGPISGLGGTGALAGDPYLVRRGEDGWVTASSGPDGAEAPSLNPGSVSPDQGYSFWNAEGEGSAAIDGEATRYVRYPDGHSELIGRGSLATDAHAAHGLLISENGGHIVFNSSVQLEPGAPPDGTRAIYDRSADGVTHVVSLLPGNLTPAAGQSATFEGASLDGRGVAFSIGSKLYLRSDNSESYEIGTLTSQTLPTGVAFAGIAEGGARLFYLEAGDLFAFDANTETKIPFAESGDATVVNVAADGTSAYFVSPSVLSSEANPLGATAVQGAENLYLSEEGTISFVASVTKRDVEGDLTHAGSGGYPVEGLGLWIEGMALSQLSEDPSRTTPDGTVLLFESRADLTGYDPEGRAEIYRYDSVGGTLACLSCNPTQAPAAGEAHLQSIKQGLGDPEPLKPTSLIANLRADGRRAFFESSDPLVLTDTDKLQDVYEWEAEGVGSCRTEGGCVYLISSGDSARTNYLFAASASGNDVFFVTSDLLLAALDPDETPSIYDGRVDGGFPPPASVAGECLGEACQPAADAPQELTPATFETAGNVAQRAKPRCAKGKHRVRKGKKSRCVAAHKKHKPHKRTNAKRRTSR
jgi:hypothetical protein